MNQALVDRGPADAPASATDTAAGFVYRACRVGESPWNLRHPPDMSHLDNLGLRALLLRSVAKGGDPNQAVPAFARFDELQDRSEAHAGHAMDVSSWLVRRPTCYPVGCIDFADRSGDMGDVLNDWPSDTASHQGCVREARGYAVKDEVGVYLSQPPQRHVEWWCEASKQWRSVTQTPRPDTWSRTHVQMFQTSSSWARSQSDASASPPDLQAIMRQSLQAVMR